MVSAKVAKWIFRVLLTLLTTQTTVAIIQYSPTIFQICGRPYVNSTLPERVVAEIRSPEYPSDYLGPHDCTLTVVLPQLSWIGFYSSQLEMLQQNGPCNDYLLIQNPNHAKYRYIRCENITNRQLLYQDSSAFDLENINIRFHADMFNASTIQEAKPQKFALEYVVADIIYPGKNYNHSRRVVSHGYGYIVSHSSFTGASFINQYSNNIDSWFTLTGLQPDLVLEFHFLSFQLHNDLNCSDYLNITGISEDNFDLEPLILCGNEADNTAYIFTTVGDSITFHFKTGARSTNPGFQIQYYIQGSADSFQFSTEYSTDPVTLDITTILPVSGKGKTLRKKQSSANSNGVVVAPPASQRPNKLSGTDYVYLGVGIGIGNLLLAAVVITVVILLVRKRKRLSRHSESPYSTADSSQKQGGRAAMVPGSGDVCDDESAYYSEIGTFRKALHENNKNDMNLHYASRSVCGSNFYHTVEEQNSTEQMPANNLPLSQLSSNYSSSTRNDYEGIPLHTSHSEYSRHSEGTAHSDRTRYSVLPKRSEPSESVTQYSNSSDYGRPDYERPISNIQSPYYAEKRSYPQQRPASQYQSYLAVPESEAHSPHGFSSAGLSVANNMDHRQYKWRVNDATQRF